MEFNILFDKTGFPLIKNSRWDFFISIFPVSKYQFELFLCSSQGHKRNFYSDSWYRELLKKNPRCAWHGETSEPWRHFLSGESPEVFDDFIKYCGNGMRLPKIDEWRQLLEVEHHLNENTDNLYTLCDIAAPPVRHWLRQGLGILTNEGMLEFVQSCDSSGTTIIGRPFTSFHPNLWSPGSEREIERNSKLWNIVSFRLAMSK